MQNAKFKIQNAKFKIQNAKYKIPIAKCKKQNANYTKSLLSYPDFQPPITTFLIMPSKSKGSTECPADSSASPRLMRSPLCRTWSRASIIGSMNAFLSDIETWREFCPGEMSRVTWKKKAMTANLSSGLLCTRCISIGKWRPSNVCSEPYMKLGFYLRLCFSVCFVFFSIHTRWFFNWPSLIQYQNKKRLANQKLSEHQNCLLHLPWCRCDPSESGAVAGWRQIPDKWSWGIDMDSMLHGTLLNCCKQRQYKHKTGTNTNTNTETPEGEVAHLRYVKLGRVTVVCHFWDWRYALSCNTQAVT